MRYLAKRATFVRVKRTSLKLLFGREATMCDHALHLVDMFMLPSNDIATVLSWRTGVESATRISWKHAGLRDCSATISTGRHSAVKLSGATITKQSREPWRLSPST